MKAHKELREGNSWVILSADKGMAIVVLDKQEYLNKDQDLLADNNPYRTVLGNTTTRHTNKVIQTLRTK